MENSVTILSSAGLGMAMFSLDKIIDMLIREQILEEFFHLRFEFYVKRKKVMLDNLEKEEAQVEDVTGRMEGRADKPLAKASRQVGKNQRKNTTKKANEADTVVESIASVSTTAETGHVFEGAKLKGRGAPKKAPVRKQKMPTAVDSEEEDDEVLELKE